MYCEYWNLHKAPFDNVPDPSMYVDCHVSMENVIAETIFAIKEGNEAFAVIIGDVGLGKTLSLRIIMDSLEPNKYKVVLITNPSISFTQLMREIIGQITGHQCDEKRKLEQLEIFNHLLFETIDQGQKIVIFIDEANSLSLANLENLRLLTNMQDDQRNLFTLVLAGQMELARRLEHPKRTNLFQRIGTYGRIDKIPSEDAVKTYVETRLKHAGTQTTIFNDDCIPEIWEYSEHGVPRLINKICKLCLKAGETNGFNTISADIVTQIAERFQKLSKTAFQKRKSRNRLDIELTPEEMSILVNVEEFPEIILSAPEKLDAPSVIADICEIQTEQLSITPQIDRSISFEHSQIQIIPVLEIKNDPAEALAIQTPEQTLMESNAESVLIESLENKISVEVASEILEAENHDTTIESIKQDVSPQTEFLPVEAPPPTVDTEKTPESFVLEKEKELTSIIFQNNNFLKQSDGTPVVSEPEFVSTESISSETILIRKNNIINESPQDHFRAGSELNVISHEGIQITEIDNDRHPNEGKDDQFRKTEHVSKNEYDEMIIGNYRILLTIPKDIIKQVKSFNHQSANKSAGYWAAQIIKKNPQLTHSPYADPVALWYEIKDNILKKISV